jgi:cytosine/adenosine deaminase-related metal-dependent hydrolase
MERLLDMITLHARTALGLDAGGLAVGAAADLVVLGGVDARQVLARHNAPRHVVRAGRPVAATATTSDVEVPESTQVAATGRRHG